MPTNINLDILKKVPLTSTDEELATTTWKDIYSYRRETAFVLQSAAGILDEYKVLQSHLGPELIRYDFHKLFGTDVDTRMLSNWPASAIQIIGLVTKTVDVPVSLQHPQEGDRIAESVFKIIDFTDPRGNLLQNQKIYNDAHRDALAVSLLPTLIQHNIPQHKDTKNWKISATEKAQAFFENIEKHEDLQNLILSKGEKYKKYNLKSQPYIVVCGTFQNITCQHVVIDNVTYDCDNPADALDLCYKLFFVLNLNYTHACPHVWSFVQRHLYKMNKERKLVQAGKISNLISKLNKIL